KQLSVQHLECSTTRQDGMRGFVYRRHSTSPDLSHDPISTHQGVWAKFGEALGRHGACRCTNLARGLSIQDPADPRADCLACRAGARGEAAASRAGTWCAPGATVMVSSQVEIPSAPDHDFQSGPLHSGHLISAYRIERLAGMGGMGWVYRARHELTAR